MNSRASRMHSDDKFKMSSTENISNKNYEADIKHTLWYTRYFLGFLGLWPMASQKSTKIEKYLSKFMILISLMMPTFILIPATHYAILREKNFIARLVIAGPMGFFLANFLKYIFVILRCRMIKICIEHVTADWMSVENEKERATMKRNVKVGHDLTIISSVFTYTGGLWYNLIMPLWSEKTVNEFNETVRPLVYPGYDTFVESQSSPTYEIIYCTIYVSSFFSCTVANASCNVAAIFVTHACGQIQILISRLGCLVQEYEESENSQKIQERISFIIRCHVRVLRLASSIEVILREICLVEMVASMITICLYEYCLMMELDKSGTAGIIAYVTCWSSVCFSIYIFCHIGELLKEQYHQIGVAAYMIEWYRLPGKLGLDIIMIIIMSNCSRNLTAGGMTELSVSSFGAVIKITITYFNMLRGLTD